MTFGRLAGRRRATVRIALMAAASLIFLPFLAQAQDLTIKPGQRVLPAGERLDFEGGILRVPEHHAGRKGKKIEIPFERYRARTKTNAAPIFILAGGPGDSAIERLDKKAGADALLFYSEFADVVVFDQRGGGLSKPKMNCGGDVHTSTDGPSEAKTRILTMRQMVVRCREEMTDRGIDLTAYNTIENGEDVVELARTLGYGKITLIGGSYGSHLAMWLMRRHPQMIDRVVMRGIEGPDDTYDLPSGILAALTRIAKAAEADPALADKIPPGGLIAAFAKVIKRLTDNPVAARYEGKSIVVGGDDVRAVAKTDADRSGGWAANVINLYNGDYTLLAKSAIPRRSVGINRPMLAMMDCASGISPARKQKILTDPANRLLGNINEEYFATCDLWKAPDLGNEFRSPLRSDIPTLIFHGTWDVNTPLENADDAAAGLTDVAYAKVEGGTHPVIDQLFELWAPMRPTMRKFLEGGKPELPQTIVLPTVNFKPPAQ